MQPPHSTLSTTVPRRSTERAAARSSSRPWQARHDTSAGHRRKMELAVTCSVPIHASCDVFFSRQRKQIHQNHHRAIGKSGVRAMPGSGGVSRSRHRSGGAVRGLGWPVCQGEIDTRNDVSRTREWLQLILRRLTMKSVYALFPPIASYIDGFEALGLARRRARC